MVVMIAGMTLRTASVAHADDGCPTDGGDRQCGWCGEMAGCTLDHCVWTPGGGPCGCTYNCPS